MSWTDELLDAVEPLLAAASGVAALDELQREAQRSAATIKVLALAAKGREVGSDRVRQNLAEQLATAVQELAIATGNSPGLYQLEEPDSRGADILPVNKEEFLARSRRAAERSIEGPSGVGARSVVSLYLRPRDGQTLFTAEDELPLALMYINCRFEGAEFRGIGAFENAHFTNCRFTGCRFVDLQMPDVVFSHCVFEQSSFETCDLSRASFLFTRFVGVSFIETWGEDMSIASCFFGGTGRGASAANNAESGSSTNRIDHCRLGQLHMSRTVCFDLDFVSSRLEAAVIDQVKFARGSEFRSVTLDDALLVGSSLSGVSLVDTTLTGALLVRVDLGDARFQLTNEDVTYSPVDGATFRDCLAARTLLTDVHRIEKGVGGTTVRVERSTVRDARRVLDDRGRSLREWLRRPK